MIPANYYRIIYLLVVVVATIIAYIVYNKKNSSTNQNSNFLLFLVTFLILFIGNRPNNVTFFTDTANYYVYYDTFYKGSIFQFNFLTENLIFDNLLAFWGSLDLGMPSFVLLITTLYFGCTYAAIKRMFKTDALVAYIVFLGAFSTFSYATNGIKSGAAASIFLLALSYRNKKTVCILLSLLSLGFHHSMQLPVVALILSLIYKNSKVYLWIWIVCALLSPLNLPIFRDFFSGLTDEKGGEYLISEAVDWGGKSGFRPDFLIYSAMPVLVGWWAIFKKKISLSANYICILNIYLITNSVWMLCMYASYTNRIAYLSWLMYPVVLIYPFLNEKWGDNRYSVFSNVMIAHLGFLLFMSFIYY